MPAQTRSITRTNHAELCEKAAGFSDILSVFPLYADGIPVPLPKRMFVAASTVYWKNYGKRNGITKKQMESMAIEP